MGEKWPKESGSNDRLTANAEYTASLAAGLEALLCVGFLGGAYASGNAAPAVAVLLLRDWSDLIRF